MWLLRKDNRRVCKLPAKSDTVTVCPAETPAGHSGALSLVSGQPGFVDTSEGKLYPVGDKGFGPAATLGGPTGANIRPSATDVSGRVVLLDPDKHTLSVVDPKADPKASTPPVTVQLPMGDYTEPAVGGSVITVVETTTGTVLTYDEQGRERDHQEMPKGSGRPRLTTGDDDHVYVEGDKGTHVMVVGDDGDVADVPLDRAPARTDTEPDKQNKDTSAVPPPSNREHDERSEDKEHEQQAPPPSSEAPERKKELPPVVHHDPAPPEHHEPPAPPVVPASPPGAPTGVRADAGSDSVTLHWSAAQDNGSAITGYHLTWKSSAGSGSRDVGPNARSVKVSGLTNGTKYTFSVAAKNKAGRGSAASAKAVTPAAAAGPPGVLPIYDDSNGNALVSWSAPADMGGGTLVHYTVDATGMQQRTATGTSLLVTNLPHDGRAITFTVRAITKTSTGQLLTGAPGSFTWPGSSGGGGSGGGPTVKITRGEKDCPDHEDEPTCAKMHVVLTGFEPNTEYDITPHSSNDDYHADDAHYTTDDNGRVSFDTFQYYWVGDDVWVSVCVDDENSVESNHMKWTAS
jgi:fibronectin type III domain protein